MWKAWSGFAALPLGEVLPPDQVAALEADFMARATAYARGLLQRQEPGAGDGMVAIAEPYTMLLVVGTK